MPTALAMPDPRDPDAIRAHLAATRPDPTAVRSWAGRLLPDRATHGPVPLLGNPAWRALPDHDPRKLRAAILAAIARLDENTPAAIDRRLRAELHAQDRAVADRLKAASVALSGALDWRKAADRIPHAELARRRTVFPGRAKTPAEIRADARNSWGITTHHHANGEAA